MQHHFELRQQLLVTLGLMGGGEGVHVSKFRPRYRNHLDGRVQLHGATAEWDHGLIEGNVLLFKPTHVAHHLSFGMVVVEQRMLQVVDRAL